MGTQCLLFRKQELSQKFYFLFTISSPTANLFPAQTGAFLVLQWGQKISLHKCGGVGVGRLDGADGQKFRNCLRDIPFAFQLRG